MKFSLQKLVSCFLISLLAACGGATGGGGAVSFTAVKVFSDNAGVARGVSSGGGELVYIAPNIVADVAASNASGASSSVDVSQYPIVSQASGYNLRQGVMTLGSTSFNVVVAEKIGSGDASIAYLYNNSSDAIATISGNPFSSAPSGSHTYSGLYFAGARNSNFSETGTMSLTANFSSNTFTINNASGSTSLTGSGFIDSANGRISSGTLTFNSPSSTYTASTVGNLSGSGATEVKGVFYTNDANPDYAGAFAGSR